MLLVNFQAKLQTDLAGSVGGVVPSHSSSELRGNAQSLNNLKLMT